MVTSLIKQTPGILRAPGPRARESTMGRSGWVWKYRSKTSGWSCAGGGLESTLRFFAECSVADVELLDLDGARWFVVFCPVRDGCQY